MNRYFLLILAFLFAGANLVPCLSQTDNDPILMTINGIPVLRSEFEYNYNKNKGEDVIDSKTIKEYTELFINYKLKVCAALDAKLDKTKSFQDEYLSFRDKEIYPLVIPESAKEKEMRTYYNGMLRQLGGKDLRLPAHIFLKISPNCSAEEKNTIKTRIDSIYRVLKAGADFSNMAKKHSDDAQSAKKGGEITWCGPGQLLPEFEKVMYNLKKGEISAPFLSTAGYHIMLLKDTKQLEPYETLKSQIQDFLEKRGMSNRLVDSIANLRGLSSREFLDIEAERLSANNKDLKYRLQEYHDGLLLYEISDQTIWSKNKNNNEQVRLEKQWVAELRKKYKFSINSAVLATVDNHSKSNSVHQDQSLASNQSKTKQTTNLQPQRQTTQPKAGIDIVDTGIPVTNLLNKNTFAIIIANENYSRETKVDFAKNDGEVFKNYCQKTMGLPEKNIHFLPDATLNDLIGELDWLQQVCRAYKGEANVIFYYAGHGLPDETSNSSYLLPTDGNSRLLRTCFSINELYETLGKLPAKKITVVMDACFSGAKRNGDMLASARGVALKAKAGVPRGNMIVLSAAQGDETAYKYEEAHHGLFTYFLLKKLKESKGNVTMGELSSYLQDQVGRYSIVENGKSQTPTIQASETLRSFWKNATLY